MKKNDNRIYIRIKEFEFSPSEISEKLNLEPTEIGIKGEEYIIKGAKRAIVKTWEFNYWEYRFRKTSNQFINEILDEFFELRVLPNFEVLKEFAKQSNISILIAQSYYDGCNPGFYFDRKQMEILNELKAELDIDVYCLSKK